mmetsp:Transcript_33399/g.45410  ORF Transcript_33399/g.45410 Transcript_33399/m.45410 type:complete len:213 (+) Transcript_33399:102-740(+)
MDPCRTNTTAHLLPKVYPQSSRVLELLSTRRCTQRRKHPRVQRMPRPPRPTRARGHERAQARRPGPLHHQLPSVHCPPAFTQSACIALPSCTIRYPLSASLFHICSINLLWVSATVSHVPASLATFSSSLSFITPPSLPFDWAPSTTKTSLSLATSLPLKAISLSNDVTTSLCRAAERTMNSPIPMSADTVPRAAWEDKGVETAVPKHVVED